MKRIIFIEGTDGAGKSTIAEIAKDWAKTQPAIKGKAPRVGSTHVLYDVPQMENYLLSVLRPNQNLGLTAHEIVDTIATAAKAAQERFWLLGLAKRLASVDTLIVDRSWLSFMAYNAKSPEQAYQMQKLALAVLRKWVSKGARVDLIYVDAGGPITKKDGDIHERSKSFQQTVYDNYKNYITLECDEVRVHHLKNPINAKGVRTKSLASIKASVKSLLK